MIAKYEKTKSKILGTLQSFVALGAIPAGISMIFTPDGSKVGMSTSILQNSPFNNFLIPGIVLLVVNGLLNIVGAVYSFMRYGNFHLIGLLLGGFLIIWICIQIYLIGFIHVLQPVFLAIGIIETLISLSIKKNTIIV